LDFEKSYAVISFKIFNALSRKKKWKSNFLYWLIKADLMNLRRWTQCSSVDTVQFSLRKKAVKWRINADTWRVWAWYLGCIERLL
jgi:hypothetical protein